MNRMIDLQMLLYRVWEDQIITNIHNVLLDKIRLVVSWNDQLFEITDVNCGKSCYHREIKNTC